MSNVGKYLDPALLERLNQLQLSARNVVEGCTAGTHRSRVKGASVDFRQHRSYVAGDEPRRLDWRLLARTDRPFVREYHEETNLRALLMLDHSGSMAYGGKFGAKFDYAARIVAALAYLMLAQTESVGLAMCGDGIDQWLAPHSRSQQLARIIEALEGATAEGTSATDAAMGEIADRLDRRCLIVLVSDFFIPLDRLRMGFARLRHDRHELIAIQILEPDELSFPFRRYSRFRGLEGEFSHFGDAVLLRKTYLDSFQRHCRELEQDCRSLGVELTRMVIDRPLDDALLSFLRRRRPGA